MQEQSINLNHYISVVSQLAFKAALISKECAQNPNLKKYEKGVNDPVTEADFKIQTILIKAIHHFFPSLKIIGEETTQYEGQIDLDLASISLNPIQQEFEHQTNAPIGQFCVWIDPIDNTKGFINGTLDCVAVLIGLSRNLKAYIGIVALPYSKQGQKIVYNPEVLVGSVPAKKAFSTFDLKKWNRIEKPVLNNPLKFVISDTRGYTQQIQKILDKCHATLHRVGGSGKKIIQVVKGQMDALLYLRGSNHKWDSCGPQAILLAIGGQFSDEQGNSIIYDPTNKNTVNMKGNICIFDSQLFKSIISDLITKQANTKL